MQTLRLHPHSTVVTLFLALCAISTGASAKIHRDHRAVAEFKRSTPCPATGKPEKRCKGYVVDHVIALKCGGPDKPSNMQWQTIAEAKAKDKCETKECGK